MGRGPVTSLMRDPVIVRAGFWVTKRRGVILTPVFAVALVAARFAIHPVVEWAQDLVGLGCLLAGTWLRLVAASYHESEHGSGPITAGPYAWIRHPLYVANFILGWGIVLLAGWWPMAGVYLLVFLPIHAVIMRAEEVHLASIYGAQYVAYARAVPAVIPWRSYQGPRIGRRTTYKLRRGHERLKVLGYCLGVAALMVIKQHRPILSAWPIPALATRDWVVAAALAAGAILYRAPTRRAWVRGCQTAVATASILLLAVHVPGVWPAPSPARACGPPAGPPASSGPRLAAGRLLSGAP